MHAFKGGNSKLHALTSQQRQVGIRNVVITGLNYLHSILVQTC